MSKNREKMTSSEKQATVGVRLLGLFFFMVGFWMLIGNVIDSIGDFNPAYIGYYVLSELVRPVLACAIGLLLWWRARSLARRMARGLCE